MEETMMDPRVIELMSPVSTDNPCGEDLSFSPEFDRIHEARREDDPTLDYGEWESALKQADWKSVATECELLLKNKTKDLRVAAWLTEGLIKTSGLAGLRRGLEVHVGLFERFGEDIHPRGDDGDQERRIGTMSWFVQRAAHLARSVPLTDSASGRFSLMDYDGAVGLQLQLQRPNPTLFPISMSASPWSASPMRWRQQKASTFPHSSTSSITAVGWCRYFQACLMQC
jgi:type VI secretion system protein ImpA